MRETSGAGVGDGSPDGLGVRSRGSSGPAGVNEGSAATGWDGSSTKISFAARAQPGHGAADRPAAQ